MMVIGMALEVFGVGAVLPAISLMVGGDSVATEFLAPFLPQGGEDVSQEEMILFGSLFLIGIYFLKSTFLSYLIYRQTSYAFDLQASLSDRLFRKYMRQEYLFFKKTNSSELIRNTIGEVNLFTFSFVLPAMIILTEILVILGLCTLMLVVQPIATLALAGICGIAMAGYQFLIGKRISKWGAMRQIHDGKRIEFVQRGVGAVKMVKISDKLDHLFDSFSKSNLISAKMGEKQKTVARLPRVWLEFLAVVGLAGFLYFSFDSQSDAKAVVPTLGLFVAAALRLLPSFTRVLSSFTSIRFAVPVLSKLEEEMRLGDGDYAELKPATPPLAFDGEIKLDRVSFEYPDAQRRALKDVSLQIRKGQAVGLIGPSGAGKSTMVDLLLGLIQPDIGTISLDGTPLTNLNRRQWQDKLGYVQQDIYLIDDTIRNNVAFGIEAGQIQDDFIWNILGHVNLASFVRGLPDGLDTNVGERGVNLSGGQIQRIGICRALYSQPEVLLLDEATSALDVETEARIVDSLQKLKGELTIIIVAHRLSTIAHCDVVHSFEDGELAWSGTAEDAMR